MSLPGVSWLCPTYGRCPDYQHLLEERIESFLRQDYQGSKELVVLNDAPEQELVCDAPGVCVVNWPVRFSSLGAKYNHLVSLSHHDLLMPAEDDDLHLPWAITQAVEQLGSGEYWKPPQIIFLQADQPPVFKHPVGIRHHASIFTRQAWLRVGGYPPTSGNQDALFDAALGGDKLPRWPQGIPPEEWAFVYRWGVSPSHLSGNTDHEAFYRQWGQRPVVVGCFALRPHWREDYVVLCQPTPPI